MVRTARSNTSQARAPSASASATSGELLKDAAVATRARSSTWTAVRRADEVAEAVEAKAAADVDVVTESAASGRPRKAAAADKTAPSSTRKLTSRGSKKKTLPLLAV